MCLAQSAQHMYGNKSSPQIELLSLISTHPPSACSIRRWSTWKLICINFWKPYIIFKGLTPVRLPFMFVGSRLSLHECRVLHMFLKLQDMMSVIVKHTWCTSPLFTVVLLTRFGIIDSRRICFSVCVRMLKLVSDRFQCMHDGHRTCMYYAHRTCMYDGPSTCMYSGHSACM